MKLDIEGSIFAAIAGIFFYVLVGFWKPAFGYSNNSNQVLFTNSKIAVASDR
ncbi:MAG TPA: hypothetical protein VG733_08730 [Chthoniobacteraceae bacterium]|nr:hypothetical protein [Chthoniobacteraceae bacterium]